MKRWGLAIAIGVAAWAGAQAQAQTVQLACSFQSSQMHMLSNGRVTPQSTTPPRQSVPMTLDFDAGTFSLGSTSGNILVESDRIVAMARGQVNNGLWDIDRTTGRMTAVGYAASETESLFYRGVGQCQRADGNGSAF